jgi:hypothetical protein
MKSMRVTSSGEPGILAKEERERTLNPLDPRPELLCLPCSSDLFKSYRRFTFAPLIYLQRTKKGKLSLPFFNQMLL